MGILKDIMKSIFHPQEIKAMFKVKFTKQVDMRQFKGDLRDLAKELKPIDYCYACLQRTSRSFAVVIQQLPQEMRDAVAVFYLVLRALDSVEDDVGRPESLSVEDRVALLRVFYQKLDDPKWSVTGVGDKEDYRKLLENFPAVTAVFQSLNECYRRPIQAITKEMGEGMAKYAEMVTVDTREQFTEYCYYVAGLVGYGLSDLFAASGLEDAELANQKRLSNAMGQHLQQTNIIRDYFEDLEDGRTWYPKEVWSKYAQSLSDFAHAPEEPNSLACLNEMVTNALEMVPESLEYLAYLRDPQIFAFCAIPQVMAIATLAAVYNNPDTFRSVVKIRKGLAAKIMCDARDLQTVHTYFRLFADSIAVRIPHGDPNADRTLAIIERIRQLTTKANLPTTALRVSNAIAWIVLIISMVYLFSSFDVHDGNGLAGKGSFGVIIAGFCSVAYLFGFMGMSYV